MSSLTLILFSSIVLMNIFVNLYFLLGSRKHKVYQWSSIYWVAAFLFFISQGVFKDLKYAGLAIMLISLNDYAVLKMTSILLNIKVPDKFYLKTTGLFFSVGILLSFFVKFEIFTSVLAIGCVFPYFHFMISNFKEIIKKSGIVQKVILLTYSINVAHLLDFPITKPDPQLSIIAFNMAFAFTLIMSFFIYLTADDVYIKTIVDRLNDEIEKKKSLYKTIAANDVVVAFSHEINNAIQIIQFNQELILLQGQTLNSQPIEKCSKNIQISIDKINDILSPFYNEQKNSNKTPMMTVVNEAVSFLEPFLKEKNIDFALDADQIDGRYIYCSKGLLSQVLVHAVKLLSKRNDRILSIVESNKISFFVNDTSNLDLDLISFMITKLDITHTLSDSKLTLDLSKLQCEKNAA